MPDFIKVHGQSIWRPGVFPILDAEALAGLGPAPTGIVAVLGEFTQGGPPTTPLVFTSQSGLRRALDARTAAILGKLAFAPSNDPRVPNGAARLVLVRVNKAKQAKTTVQDANGIDSLVLEAWDYGAIGNEIAVQVLASTQYGGRGRRIAVWFRDETEGVDNAGYGDGRLRLAWRGNVPSNDEYVKGEAALDPAAKTFQFSWALRTPASAGTWTPVDQFFDGAITFTTTDDAGTPTAPGANNSITLTVSGTNKETGQADTESVTVADNSTTATTSNKWSDVTQIDISIGGAPAATKVEIAALGFDLDLSQYTTLATLAAKLNQRSDKGFKCDVISGETSFETARLDKIEDVEIRDRVTLDAGNMATVLNLPFAQEGVLTFVLAAAQANDVSFTINGVDLATGESASETVTIPKGETTGVSETTWLSLTSITTTLGAGNNVTIQTTGAAVFSNLDHLIRAVNGGLTRIVAERAPNGVAIPATQASKVNLVGGSDGIPAQLQDWKDAIDALKSPDVTVNHVVCLSDDAAVQQYLADHVDYMNTWGNAARNAFVGAPQGAGWSVLKERRRLLNSRNVALLPQAIDVFDEKGNTVTLPPYYTALLAAACDAGREELSGLAWRYVDVLAVHDGRDLAGAERWSVRDDLDQLIENGLFVIEATPQGFRWSRDVTTYAVDNNPVFSAVTANESANRSVQNMRRALETFVGSLNTGAMASTIRARVIAELERQVRDSEIKAYDKRSIEIEDLGNGFNVGYSVAVLESVYWIKLTAHVVRMPSAA